MLLAADTSAAGIAIVGVAGLISGSFTAPSLRITAWKWEHIWLVYSIAAYAALPLGWAMLAGSGLLTGVLADAPQRSFTVAIFGLLFGVGSLLFGMSWARLGVAVANALVTGVIVLAGSAGPVLAGAVRFDARNWFRLGLGCLPLLLSLALCAVASIDRDRNRSAATLQTVTWKDSLIGVALAIAGGALSAMLNVGFSLGGPLLEDGARRGYSPLIASLAVWVPLLLGGSVANIGYAALLIHRRSSWSKLSGHPGRIALWVRCFLMGLIWFGAIFLYGYGASLMGETGAVYGWALVSGAGVLGSNIVGACAGEWTGAGRRPKLLMAASTALLILSFTMLARV